MMFGFTITIPPLGISELWRTHNDLRQNEARRGGKLLDMYMDSGVQAKDQSCMGSVQDEVATRKKNFSRCRHGDSVSTHVAVKILWRREVWISPMRG